MLPVGATLLASLTSELVDSASLRYLRRIRFASRASRGKSLPLRKKQKDSRPKGQLFLVDLNYAPCGSKRRERPGERAPRYAFACLSAPDSLREPCNRGQISPTPQKAKRQSPKRATVFLAEKERFELSRRYNRPTPLAGAPLHHLSTSPYSRPWFANLPNNYINYFSICQYFFVKL